GCVPPAHAVAAPPAALNGTSANVTGHGHRGRDFLDDLRRVAAERTGYPPEMLDLDAGIEADLGIDSIKRVEILTALQHLSGSAEQANIQGLLPQLTSASSLREIAAILKEA